MRKPVAEMVGQAGSEDLGLILQPAERPGVDYTVSIPPEVIAIGMRGFGIAATKGTLNWKVKPRERIVGGILLRTPRQVSWTLQVGSRR